MLKNLNLKIQHRNIKVDLLYVSDFWFKNMRATQILAMTGMHQQWLQQRGPVRQKKKDGALAALPDSFSFFELLHWAIPWICCFHPK